MTGNEKLIEETAKAIMDEGHGEGAWEIRDPMEDALYRRRARAALAVFKKGTPTDNEREAHRRVIDLWFANWRSIGRVSPALEVAIDSLEGMVSDALDAGFRRSEVPEPSDPARITIVHEGGNTVTGTLDEVLNHGHLKPGWRYRGAEPQGEPSDAQVDERGRHWWACAVNAPSADWVGPCDCDLSRDPSLTEHPAALRAAGAGGVR